MSDIPIQQTWGSKTQPATDKPVVHSWTSLIEFENCRWRYYHTKIAKTSVEGQSVQMTEGNERHKALELAVKAGVPLPEKYASDTPIIEQIRKSPGMKIVEWQFGLTRDWTETKFFASDVWLRGKIDVGVIGTKSAVIIDYKTGKSKEDYDQLGLFSIPVFVRYPYLETVKSAYLWLGESKLDPATYGKEDVPAMKAQFAHRIHNIEEAVRTNKFPKLPSGLCSWCPVGREKCEFWRAYKGLPK